MIERGAFSTIFCVVPAVVCSPGTTSIIGTRCGGLDQCMPMKRAGCCSALAIELTPMPEVLVAMIASERHQPRRLLPGQARPL